MLDFYYNVNIKRSIINYNYYRTEPLPLPIEIDLNLI